MLNQVESVVKNDYPIILDIKLSELILLSYAASRTIWFLIFGVVTPNFSYYFNPVVWISFFTVVTLSHITALIYRNNSLRFTATCGYALAWGTLAFLSIAQGTRTPSFPNYAVLFIVSVLVAYYSLKKSN